MNLLSVNTCLKWDTAWNTSHCHLYLLGEHRQWQGNFFSSYLWFCPISNMPHAQKRTLFQVFKEMWSLEKRPLNLWILEQACVPLGTGSATPGVRFKYHGSGYGNIGSDNSSDEHIILVDKALSHYWGTNSSSNQDWLSYQTCRM